MQRRAMTSVRSDGECVDLWCQLTSQSVPGKMCPPSIKGAPKPLEPQSMCSSTCGLPLLALAITIAEHGFCLNDASRLDQSSINDSPAKV